MLLTFHCGLRERIRTFGLLIPNQALCQTELLGESFQIWHKFIIHHITSYVKFYLLHFVWCPKPDSNRHDRSRGILSPLRLPISPFGQRFVFHFKFNISSLYITLRLMSNFIYIILWSPRKDSNLRPLDPKSSALPNWATRRKNYWWNVLDSNQWLSPCKGDTLPTELTFQVSWSKIAKH